VTGHTLHIHAEHEAEEEIDAEDYIHRERRRTDVSRSIPLPEEVDRDEVSASYEDGVLTVTLPKAGAEAEAEYEVTIS
jgi:HSP20 family protein